MGGQSTSELETDRDGRLVFVGEISTVGGGFASLRTTEDTAVVVPKGKTDAIKVVVEGDGQMYVLFWGGCGW